MVTSPTPGTIYLVESENGVEDWITDHAGDPDDIDFSQFTAEGTDWCQFPVPKGWNVIGHTGTIITTLGGSIQYSRRKAARWYDGGARSIETSIANANLIDKFIMSDRHTSGSSTTFKPYYLICYHGLNSSNLCTTFIDYAGNQKSYCLIESIDFQRAWIDTQNQVVRGSLRFASVWRSV